VAEFEDLLPCFGQAWDEYREESLSGKERRRKPGGGAVPTTLRTHEDQLFFILVYVKLHPLQAVLGFLFGMSQGRANEWIARLSSCKRPWIWQGTKSMGSKSMAKSMAKSMGSG